MNPEALERLRFKKGLSITEVSKMMGKTPGWYSRIKDGKQVLKPKYVVPLAQIFGVNPDQLSREYFSGFQLEETSRKVGEQSASTA